MYAEQLGPLDAAYLALDSPTTSGTVCLMLQLDGQVDLATVRRHLVDGVTRMPDLRRRLHGVAKGLGRPWWVDDPHFDIDAHLGEHEVPSPGGARATAATVSQLSMRHLDRHRPLWRVEVLQDRLDRSTSLLVCVHHAVADGFRMRQVLGAFTSRRPSQAGPRERVAPADAWIPRAVPPELELLARAALRTGRWGVSAALTGGRVALTSPPWRPLQTALELPPAPATPFNRAVSGRRTWVYGTLELAASRRLRTHYRVTVNDVVHAVIAAALRDWLRDRDTLPDRPLVAMVPVSMRAGATDTAGANRIGVTLCQVPTEQQHPLDRLRQAHRAMSKAKTRPVLDDNALDALARVFGLALPTAVQTVSSWHLLDRLPSPINLVVSNVPMFDDHFYVGPRQVSAVYPMAPIFEGVGLNITIQGYQHRLDVGVAACPELVPDVDRLWARMQQEYSDLCALG